MPSLAAQLTKEAPSEEDILEERAWDYYYRFLKCPITPMLLELIKGMLRDTTE